MSSLARSSGISSLRVIVVNARSTGGRALAREVRSCGYRTVLCHSCQAAVPQLYQSDSAIVLIEDEPGKHSYADKIPWILEQAKGAHCKCTVVAIGGPQPRDSGEHFVRTGAFHYISRPFTQERLKALLNEARRTVSDEEPEQVDESATPHSLHSIQGAITPYSGGASLKETPATPGVLVLYDSSREPLFVEWTACLRRRLTDLIEGGGISPEDKELVRYFEFLETVDSLQAAKAFDRFVNHMGRFPALMNVAPDGARHMRCPIAETNSRTSAGRVTQYNMTMDSKMVQKLRQKAALNPNDRQTCEWLAFALYSNNLLEEATEYYLKLIDDFEPREEYYFYCANAFYKRGNIARAISMWLVAAKMAPDTMIARKSMARADRAEALLLDNEELLQKGLTSKEGIFPRLEDI